MAYNNSLRDCRFEFVLKADEAERLARRAFELGVSRANVFRRACPEIFDETDVRQGRVEGVSPRRKTA
jgi:hypothetical protein